MTCLQDKIVKTKKEHRCFGCNKKFPPKRKLRYQAGTWEGEFYSAYMCEPCYKELMINDYSDGFCGGDLREGRIETVRYWQHKRLNKESVK